MARWRPHLRCGSLAALALFAAVGDVAAHGELHPLRGGLVGWSRELSVELVCEPEGSLHLYVDDHGKSVSIENSKGSVNIWRGERQDTVQLLPAGSERLVGSRGIYGPGDRLQVIVNFPDGRLIVARLVATTACGAGSGAGSPPSRSE